MPDKQIPTNLRVSLFGLPLDIGIDERDLLEQFDTGSCLLTYLNPQAYSICRKNPSYATDLTRFNFVVCDGIGIQAAVKSFFNCRTAILTPDFSGIAHTYLEYAAKKGLSLCLVGGRRWVVEKAAAVIDKKYPGLGEIDSFCGYGDDLYRARERITESAKGMVLVGMGIGRQETFLLELSDGEWNGIGICVGGFFDKLARPELEYPAWSEKIRLRFLGRLLKEPRRLSRRYFVEYQPFIKLFLRNIFLNRGS